MDLSAVLGVDMRNKNVLQKTSDGVENENATRARNDVLLEPWNDREGR